MTSYDEISSRVIAFMHSYNRFLIEKAHVGSGKTINTLKTLSEQGYTWIYLAPFHHNIVENLEQSVYHNFKYLHLKSRAKTCVLPQYRALAERNINIRPICEGHCSAKDVCPYYITKEELNENPQNWAGVHHHITEFLSDFLDMWHDKQKMYNYYDAIVIDENPINVLFVNETATADHLAHFRDVITRIGLDDKLFRSLKRFINFLINSFAGGSDLNYDRLHRKFNRIDFLQAYDLYQEALVECVIDNTIQIDELPRDFLNWFSRMQRYETRENLEQMIVKKEASGYTRKHYYFMSYERDALKGLQPKIIALDGTANIEIWQALVAKRASIYKRQYKYKDLYRLNQSQAQYPLSSWVDSYFNLRETGLRLIDLIQHIYRKKKNKVLVIGTKALLTIIKPYLDKKQVKYGYYYYLRSRNDFYQQCDTIILACQPNIPEFQISCFSVLSGWKEEIWRKVFTDEEMVQAMGRIRQNLIYVPDIKRNRETPIEIYIFPYKRALKYEIDGTTYCDYVDDGIPEGIEMDYNQMHRFVTEGVLPGQLEDKRSEELYEHLLDNKDTYTETSFMNYIQKKYKITYGDARDLIIKMEEEEMIYPVQTTRQKINPRMA